MHLLAASAAAAATAVGTVERRPGCCGGGSPFACKICLLGHDDDGHAEQATTAMPCCGGVVHVECVKQVLSRRDMRQSCCACTRALDGDIRSTLLRTVSRHSAEGRARAKAIAAAVLQMA